MVFIQPHGFGKKSTDPDLIRSNGSKEEPDTDYLSTMMEHYEEIDNSLTFKVAHVDEDWTRLIARTNTQGRLLNGSDDPCNTDASHNSGRFIHVEQAYEKLRDSESNWKKLANVLLLTFPENRMAVDVSKGPIPNEVFLNQNYPNPFNPTTTIRYDLPQGGDVTLVIYDVLGREVKVLVSREVASGFHEAVWDGRDDVGEEVAAGIYLYRLQAGGSSEVRKMVVLR